MNPRSREVLGLVAYNAFRSSQGGPVWLDLTPEVRAAWCDAGQAAYEAEQSSPYPLI